MKKNDIVLHMTKFEEKFQHDQICIMFQNSRHGKPRLAVNFQEITNFVDFFDNRIFTPEDRTFLEEIKAAASELEIFKNEKAEEIFGTSFKIMTKRKKKKFIESLPKKDAKVLHFEIDAFKTNFNNLTEKWGEIYHIPEFLTARGYDNSIVSGQNLDLQIWKDIQKSLQSTYGQRNIEKYVNTMKRQELIRRNWVNKYRYGINIIGRPILLRSE